jgi:hypothetical protein
MRKASSIFACRQGRQSWACRIDQLGDIRPAERAIPSSAASACEQAFSRELLLPLTRDTVLAAVPWLRSLAKARH